MRKIKILFFMIFACLAAKGQDSTFARQVIEELSSKKYYGRGFACKGDSIAADFIAKKFYNYGLTNFHTMYKQYYTRGVNVMEGKALVNFGKSYKAKQQGDDLKIDPMSATTKGTFDVVYANKEMFTTTQSIDLSNKFLFVDVNLFAQDKNLERIFYKTIYNNTLNAKGYIVGKNGKHSYGTRNVYVKANHCIVYINNEKILAPLTKIKINLDAKFIDNYVCQNVVGLVKGSSFSEKNIIVGAHYDHLGMVGKKVWYPGAQDNASGVAFLLDLARHFSKAVNQPKYNIYFVAFDGEESGLVGSSYFVENSIVDLTNTLVMLNFDLVGSGEDGIGVIGGEDFPEIMNRISTINDKNNYTSHLNFSKISQNSDHYSFYKAGVPSLFFLTAGKSGPGHHPEDLSKYLTMGGYNALFNIVVDLINSYQ